jgi:small-conductance mechanosensitive channel
LNWSRVGKRRVELIISIAHDTSAEDVDKAVKAIRRIVNEDNRIFETDQQIFLDKFSSYSLDIRIALYFKTGDYTEHLAIKHDLFLKIKAEFEKMGIEFALPFPTFSDKTAPFISPNLPPKS